MGGKSLPGTCPKPAPSVSFLKFRRIAFGVGFLADPAADAEKSYLDANERLELLKSEWDRLGNPVMTSGSTGQWVAHPLLKAINEAEVIADRLRERVRIRHRGPEPAAVLKSPVARKLKSVK